MIYSDTDNQITDEKSEETKKRLVSLLKKGEAILLVGSGSSKLADYPLWDELLDALRRQFAPGIQMPAGEYDRLKFASIIKQHACNRQSEKAYFKFLERQFDPHHVGKTHDEFHSVLVSFKFKGIVTTNYDTVLESAITEKRINENELYRVCDSIDLCEKDKSYRVSDYLRSLAIITDYQSALHLHGYYKNPESMILTEDDYLIQYGYVDSNGKKTQVPLDTLHRKVIWSLFATHSVVFIGFSMRDPFFMELLEVVRNDLNLDGDILHFAILPENEKERAPLLSQNYCVQPIYYSISTNGMSGGVNDHSGLRRLIYEMADEVGVPIRSPSLISITQRMLER